ncbi:MAG: hypothetical protein AAFT19_08900 [Pseudomonadota bacterium]
MQRTDTIPIDRVPDILAAFFDAPVVVYENGDTYDRPSAEFRDVPSVLRHIEAKRADGHVFVALAIYDPASKGHLHHRQTEVDPARFRGARMRWTLEGWGLIRLYLRFRDDDRVEVEITVNSEKRASAWARPEDPLQSPDLWDWTLVARHARRAIRVLRKAAGTLR